MSDRRTKIRTTKKRRAQERSNTSFTKVIDGTFKVLRKAEKDAKTK